MKTIKRNIDKILQGFRRRESLPPWVEMINDDNALIKVQFAHRTGEQVVAIFKLEYSNVTASVSPSSSTNVIIYHGKDATASTAEVISYLHQYFKQSEKAQKLLG